jgi:hypothetical protein
MDTKTVINRQSLYFSDVIFTPSLRSDGVSEKNSLRRVAAKSSRRKILCVASQRKRLGKKFLASLRSENVSKKKFLASLRSENVSKKNSLRRVGAKTSWRKIICVAPQRKRYGKKLFASRRSEGVMKKNYLRRATAKAS